MWKVTYLLDFDSDYEKFKFGIPRGSSFKLSNVYFTDYHWDEFSTCISVITYINEENIQKAERIARKCFHDSMRILSFLYEKHVEYSIVKVDYKEIVAVDVLIEKANKNNLGKIQKFDELLVNLDPEKLRIGFASMNYYSKGLELLSLNLYEESFLSVFKSMEILANFYSVNLKTIFNNNIVNMYSKLIRDTFREEYQNQHKDKEIFDSAKSILEDLVTTRRKLNFVIKQLNLEEDEAVKYLGQMVQYRTTAAHGNITGRELNLALFSWTFKLSKKMISKFMLEENDKIAYLKTS